MRRDGIWYDADNVGALIEGNIVEDNGRDGISYEISDDGIIRNNIIRRSGSRESSFPHRRMSKFTTIRWKITLRGIQYFMDCGAVGGGRLGWDLLNNSAHHNTVKIGTRRGSLANTLAAVKALYGERIDVVTSMGPRN